VTRPAESIRALWFPLVLAALALVHGFGSARHFVTGQPGTRFHVAVRESDSLAATAEGQRGVMARIFGEYFSIQEVLGGARLVAPQRLRLKRDEWRDLGRVALLEGDTRAVEPALEEVLRGESPEPLPVGGWRLHLVGSSKPPWDEPLHLLHAVDSRSLYVVTAARLARLPEPTEASEP
jgi:hypothetical protein